MMNLQDTEKIEIIEFDLLDSTNAKAKELAAGGAKPWTVILAKKQSGGYGRKGQAWYSPAGGLYFSVIMPKSNIDDLQLITIFAAVAVGQIIKNDFVLEPFIKLPNDVYINSKKVCGILTENVIDSRIKLSVMGIGLNTNIESFPSELINSTVSLKQILGYEVDNKAILRQIIAELQKIFKLIS